MKSLRTTMLGLFGAMAILLTACAEQYVEESYTLTGLYGPGFGYTSDGYGNWWWNGTFENVRVGIPFEATATGNCYDSAGNPKTEWSDFQATISIFSGELPPGLEFIDHDTIAGVPTRAGTWYLRVAFTGLYCAGTYYEDRYQDLTIKTIGS